MSSRIENSSAATRASTEPMQRSCMRLSRPGNCTAQTSTVSPSRREWRERGRACTGKRQTEKAHGRPAPTAVRKPGIRDACQSHGFSAEVLPPGSARRRRTSVRSDPRNMDGTTAGGRGGRSPAVPSLRTLQGARGGVYRGFDGDDDRSWRWIRVPQQEWRGGRNSDALTMQTASDDIRIGFDEQRKRLCTGRGSQFDFDEAIAALLLLAAQPQRGPLEFFDGRLGDKVLSGAAQDECRKRLLLRSITESSPCPFVDRCIGRAPDRFSQFRVEGIKEMVLSRAFSIERPKQGGERARDKSDCRRKREGPPRVLADIARRVERGRDECGDDAYQYRARAPLGGRQCHHHQIDERRHHESDRDRLSENEEIPQGGAVDSTERATPTPLRPAAIRPDSSPVAAIPLPRRPAARPPSQRRPCVRRS